MNEQNETCEVPLRKMQLKLAITSKRFGRRWLFYRNLPHPKIPHNTLLITQQLLTYPPAGLRLIVLYACVIILGYLQEEVDWSSSLLLMLS